MSISLDGLELFYRAVLDANPAPWELDPLAMRMPWSEDAYNLRDHGGTNGKVCFGIMWDDQQLLPLPPITRAMRMVKHALIKAGHKVVDWEPFGMREATDLGVEIFNADGGVSGVY
jgi:amidase